MARLPSASSHREQRIKILHERCIMDGDQIEPALELEGLKASLPAGTLPLVTPSTPCKLYAISKVAEFPRHNRNRLEFNPPS